MAFFNQVGKKISQTGQEVAQSTKNFAAINKLNNLIANEEEKISELYLQIGKTYFEQYKDSPIESLSSLVLAVVDTYKTIEEYNNQIKEIKGITNCPNCGKEVPFSSSFCNFCGEMIPEKIPENHIKCKCGKYIPNTFKFCTYCGAAIESNMSHNIIVEELYSVNENTKVCPECQTEVPKDAAFCTTCGHRF